MIIRSFVLIAAVISLVLNLYWILLYVAHRNMLSREPTQFNKRFVSIIVPAHNEEDSIHKCVASLLKLKYPSDLFEIIVVDDASTDKTAHVLEAFKNVTNVKVVRTPQNGGKKSLAVNYAREFLDARCEAVVVLDADSKVGPDTLKQVLPYLEDENTGAVSIRYLPWNVRGFLARLQYFEYLFSILWRRILSLLDSMYVTPGVFSMYKKKVIDEIGWFDNTAMTEDMEIALRIQKAGYKIGYAFSPIAHTVVPETLRAFVRQRVRWQRGFISSLRAHPDVVLSPKYGNFSAVIIPLNIASLLLVFYSFSLVLLVLSRKTLSFLRAIYKLYLVDFDIITILKSADFSPQLSLEMVVTQLQSYFVSLDIVSFFVFTSLMFALVLLVVVRYHTREKMGINLLFFPFFLVVYLPLNSAIWLYSLLLELKGAHRAW